MSINDLPANIKKHRTEICLTQEGLAGKLGVTFQAVSKWETGGSYPDIQYLPELADIFECSIDELFRGRTDSSEITLPWSDDGMLRGVIFKGSEILDFTDPENDPRILEIDVKKDAKGIECGFEVIINGDLYGDCRSCGNITVNDSVNGNCRADKNITVSCNINGGCISGGNIEVKGDLAGDCSAGKDINVGSNLEGMCRAGGNISVMGDLIELEPTPPSLFNSGSLFKE